MRGMLIRLIGNKKKNTYKKEEIKNIYIPGGRIGDVVVKTPMFREIKRKFPESKLTVSAVKSCESILVNNPYVDEVKIANEKKIKNKLLRITRLLKDAKKDSGVYDLVFESGDKCGFFDVLAARLRNPKYLVGSPRNGKYGISPKELSYIDFYADVEKGHVRDMSLDTLRALGGETGSSKEYDVVIPEEVSRKYENYYDPKMKNLLFNFRGSTERKSLKEEDLEIFVKNLEKLEGVKTHILVPPGFYERTRAFMGKYSLENVTLAPKTESVIEAASLVEKSDHVFTVDTSIVHIADAFKKPMVAIYPNNPNTLKTFSPIGSRARVVTARKFTGNDIQGFCHDEVLEAVKEMVN